MKINVEFNSLEEMQQFCDGVAVGSGMLKKAVAVQEKEAAEPVKKTKAAKNEGKVAKNESVKEEPDNQEEPPTEENPAEEPVTYTLEDVRKKLGDLQKAGHRDKVKELLQSVGAEKLPEVDPKDYALLMQKAGELDA